MKASSKVDLSDLKKLKAARQVIQKEHIRQIKGGGDIIIVDMDIL